MSATPIAVPVQVLWTVTASGQSATVTPATPLQVAVAQVHLGLRGGQGVQGLQGQKGDQGDQGPKGDTGDVTPEATAARDGAQAARDVAQGHAGTAGAQAGIATTKAGEAAGSAAAAVLARDAALVGAGLPYVDEPTGRAAVADGVAFKVQGAGEVAVFEYRRVNAGSSTLIAAYPSASNFSFLFGRSGYWGGMLSADGRIGLAFRGADSRPIFGNGGDVVGRVEAIETAIGDPEQLAAAVGAVDLVDDTRSGVLLGFKTPDGRLLGHFDLYRGTWWVRGRDALADIDAIDLRLTAVAAAVGAPTPTFPSLDWACWGDSLTAPGSSGDWPSKLAVALGVSVYNGGWGGQGHKQIAARQGGVPCLMTVTGGVIPASGSVAVTTNDYYPASNGGSVVGTLSGVSGTYTRAADGLSATFTRSASGEAVASPAKAVFTHAPAESYRDRIVTIWSGRNSFKYGADQTEVVKSIRQMIDYLSPRVKRVMVMEIPPMNTETTGTADRVTLDAMNVLLRTTFADHFLDIATWLRTPAAAAAAGISFTAQDTTDIANGVTPTSFTGDGLHPNATGGTAIAFRVQQEAQKRGWI